MVTTFWRQGEAWPDEEMPPPLIKVTLLARELAQLAVVHDQMAASARLSDDADGVAFHQQRAAYFRQKVVAVAPHLLTEHAPGRA